MVGVRLGDKVKDWGWGKVRGIDGVLLGVGEIRRDNWRRIKHKRKSKERLKE